MAMVHGIIDDCMLNHADLERGVARHEPLVERGVRRRVDDDVDLAGDLVGELGSDADVGLPDVADDGNQLPCDEAAVVVPVDFLQASEQLRVHYLHVHSMCAGGKNMVIIWMNQREECWLVCELEEATSARPRFAISSTLLRCPWP